MEVESPTHGWRFSHKPFDEECAYSSLEINGINTYGINVSIIDKVDFDLQPDDIKRIAEAKKVSVYFDSDSSYEVNGGSFEARNGWLLEIEGIQGVMKRAYHYFVDESSYADYAEEYFEFQKEEKQRLVSDMEKMQMIQRALEQKEQKKEQKKVVRKDKVFGIALIILVASIVSFIIGFIFVNIGLLIVSGVVGMVCLIVMMNANDDFKNLIEQMTSNHNGNQEN